MKHCQITGVEMSETGKKMREQLIVEINRGSKELQDYFHLTTACESSDLVLENIQLREDCNALNYKLLHGPPVESLIEALERYEKIAVPSYDDGVISTRDQAYVASEALITQATHEIERLKNV